MLLFRRVWGGFWRAWGVLWEGLGRVWGEFGYVSEGLSKMCSTWPNPPQTYQNPFRIDFGTCLFVCNPAVSAGVGSSSVLFYFFVHDGGDVALRPSVYSSNFAPISATLRQRTFWKITYFRFFDADMAQPSSNLPKSASSVLF